MKAFRDRKKAEIENWREKTNMTAWIQGIYTIAAIGACLPGGTTYPQKPMKIFTDSSTDTESQKALPQQSDIEDNIRAQSAKIDALLARK